MSLRVDTCLRNAMFTEELHLVCISACFHVYMMRAALCVRESLAEPIERILTKVEHIGRANKSTTPSAVLRDHLAELKRQAQALARE